MKKYKVAATALIAAVVMACNGGAGEGITTDLIDNPNSATEVVDSANAPIMTFDELSYDFGEISQGEKAEHEFTFTNTGKSNLLISSAVGSCGCTVPSYPEEPIAPGEEGVIHVVFNSTNKSGAQHKRVTIMANTMPSKNMVAIMGTVLAPDKVEDNSNQ